MLYFILILLAGIIIYFLLELTKIKTTKTKRISSESIKSYDNISYLLVDLTNKKLKNIEGILHIYGDVIVFDDGIKNLELISIPIKNITKCTIESKDLLMDIYKTYIRINFFNGINSSSIILHSFNNSYSTEIVQEINDRLINM